ncbi:MAG: hypothetical protein CM15mP74_22560 [Halieaceae bacterium]|nr:MAG: hypothetical protein CM15mP74_22560 [Halieaceae bacterium]
MSPESGEILGVTGPYRFRQILTGIGCLGAITRHMRMTGGEVRVLQHSPFEDADRVRANWLAHHPVAQTSLSSDDADWQTDHAVPPTSYRRVVLKLSRADLALMDLVG